MDTKICLLGLGYTGLPLALSFARVFPGTVGFDVNQARVEQLGKGIDFAGLGLEEELKRTSLEITADPARMKGCNFFVVSVPTPVDENKKPNLGALRSASEFIGRVLEKDSLVIYESTVYPGVTEEFCGPILSEVSGLTQGKDFFLGYSPERINPGDMEHSLDKVVKVVSAENEEALERLVSTYSKAIKAPLFKATSIKVAEAAKVIENTQRDLNIALMNELSLIFDRIGIRTADVLEAAGTKWNFLKFSPGLVGGHCIGVDPFYLTSKAEQVGYYPEVILAGRRINDEMGRYVARSTIKTMVRAGVSMKRARVGVLGVTFKEDVGDVRNSRVPDIISELRDFGIEVFAHDPVAPPELVEEECGVSLCKFEELKELDAIVVAVSHKDYRKLKEQELEKLLSTPAVFVDVKSLFDSSKFSSHVTYWSL